MKKRKLITKLLVATLLVSSSGLMQAGFWSTIKGFFWTTQEQVDKLAFYAHKNEEKAKKLLKSTMEKDANLKKQLKELQSQTAETQDFLEKIRNASSSIKNTIGELKKEGLKQQITIKKQYLENRKQTILLAKKSLITIRDKKLLPLKSEAILKEDRTDISAIHDLESKINTLLGKINKTEKEFIDNGYTYKNFPQKEWFRQNPKIAYSLIACATGLGTLVVNKCILPEQYKIKNLLYAIPAYFGLHTYFFAQAPTIENGKITHETIENNFESGFNDLLNQKEELAKSYEELETEGEEKDDGKDNNL